MNYLLLISSLLTISTSVFGSNESIHADVKSMTSPKSYVGLTDNNEQCTLNYVAFESNFYIAITPESYEFGEDRGSAQCLYSKACFSFSEESKVVSKKDDPENYQLEVKRPGGGPDVAYAKKMSLNVQSKDEANLLRFEVSEKVGFLNLLTVKAHCNITPE